MMLPALAIIIASIAGLQLTFANAQNQTPFLSPATGLPEGLDLLTTSISELQDWLSSGNLTSVQLVQAYLNNIERNNFKGLNLRAVIETAPRDDVIAIAESLDQERKANQTRGHLHGIPILVKDNIATDGALGMNTTAGTIALRELTPREDAYVIKRLRQAGAIIIGKANLAELAGWKGGQTEAWSAAGGQCSSAYVVGGYENGGNPAGSSSGSAVGVSAGFAAVSLGTDTTGSVIHPAGRAALFGIRPTTGLVSRSGIVPLSMSHDTVGPIGFSTWDVAATLELIAGFDKEDSATWNIPPNTPTNYTQFAIGSDHGLTKYVFGVPRRHFLDSSSGQIPESKHDACEQEIIEATDSVIVKLRNLDAFVQDPADTQLSLEDALAFEIDMKIKILNEYRDDFPMYTSSLVNRSIETLADIVKFNDRHSVVAMPDGNCCQGTLVDAIDTQGRGSLSHSLAVAGVHQAVGRGFEYVFDHHRVDAIIVSSELGLSARMIAAGGYPAAVVPLGYCNATGRPFGLTFVAPKWQEARLIEIMAAYEGHFPKRKAPSQLYM